MANRKNGKGRSGQFDNTENLSFWRQEKIETGVRLEAGYAHGVCVCVCVCGGADGGGICDNKEEMDMFFYHLNVSPNKEAMRYFLKI